MEVRSETSAVCARTCVVRQELLLVLPAHGLHALGGELEGLLHRVPALLVADLHEHLVRAGGLQADQGHAVLLLQLGALHKFLDPPIEGRLGSLEARQKRKQLLQGESTH